MTRRLRRIVVVGAGLAGMAAAERLRDRGYAGQLVIVGDEPHRPYNRTPLSKQLITGHAKPDDLRLRAYADPGADWLLGVRAAGLDLHAQAVHLDSGAPLAFDGLIIATGTTARRPRGLPRWYRAYPVRTLSDAIALDAALAGARHVAVVGGGFTGCEIAASLRARALPVSLIAPGPALMARALGPRLAPVLTRAHVGAGVALRLRTTVAAWPRAGELELSDGTRLTADAVVVATGTVPATRWLGGSGLALSETGEILCGPACHALDRYGRPHPAVVAAGDAAAWPNHLFGPVPRRVEHWINAVEMGQAAADSLLAGPARAPAYTPVPRFWSHQYGLRIQAAGMPALGTGTALLAGQPGGTRVAFAHTRPDHRGIPVLVGITAINAPRTLIARTPDIGRPFAGVQRGRQRAPAPQPVPRSLAG